MNDHLSVNLTRRTGLLTLLGGASLLLPAKYAWAGKQAEEPLIDSVRTALSSAVRNSAPPVPEFSSTEARLQYLRWLGSASELSLIHI